MREHRPETPLNNLCNRNGREIQIVAMFGGRDSNTDLFLGVPKLGKVINAVEHRPFVSNTGVQVMLLAILVHAQALEHQPLGEARLQRADFEDGVHMELGWSHGGQVLLHSSSDNGASAFWVSMVSKQINNRNQGHYQQQKETVDKIASEDSLTVNKYTEPREAGYESDYQKDLKNYSKTLRMLCECT